MFNHKSVLENLQLIEMQEARIGKLREQNKALETKNEKLITQVRSLKDRVKTLEGLNALLQQHLLESLEHCDV